MGSGATNQVNSVNGRSSPDCRHSIALTRLHVPGRLPHVANAGCGAVRSERPVSGMLICLAALSCRRPIAGCRAHPRDGPQCSERPATSGQFRSTRATRVECRSAVVRVDRQSTQSRTCQLSTASLEAVAGLRGTSNGRTRQRVVWRCKKLDLAQLMGARPCGGCRRGAPGPTLAGLWTCARRRDTAVDPALDW